MEQNTEFYERLIAKIIEIHKDSLEEILIQLKALNFFDDSFLLKLISYLKMCKLTEITCESFPDFKYYLMNIGESYFIYHDNNHCSCNNEIENKNKLNNICIHLLVFKILININSYYKKVVDKDKMMEIIKENYL